MQADYCKCCLSLAQQSRFLDLSISVYMTPHPERFPNTWFAEHPFALLKGKGMSVLEILLSIGLTKNGSVPGGYISTELKQH
jgi:hypothetical protein